MHPNGELKSQLAGNHLPQSHILHVEWCLYISGSCVPPGAYEPNKGGGVLRRGLEGQINFHQRRPYGMQWSLYLAPLHCSSSPVSKSKEEPMRINGAWAAHHTLMHWYAGAHIGLLSMKEHTSALVCKA